MLVKIYFPIFFGFLYITYMRAKRLVEYCPTFQGLLVELRSLASRV